MLDGIGRVLVCGFDGEFTGEYQHELARALNNRLPSGWYASDKNEVNRVFCFPDEKYRLLTKILAYEEECNQIVLFVWVDQETADKDKIEKHGTQVLYRLGILREIMGVDTRVFVIDGSRKMPKAKEMAEIVMREFSKTNPISMSVATITADTFKELTIVEIV